MWILEVMVFVWEIEFWFRRSVVEDRERKWGYREVLEGMYSSWDGRTDTGRNHDFLFLFNSIQTGGFGWLSYAHINGHMLCRQTYSRKKKTQLVKPWDKVAALFRAPDRGHATFLFFLFYLSSQHIRSG